MQMMYLKLGCFIIRSIVGMLTITTRDISRLWHCNLADIQKIKALFAQLNEKNLCMYIYIVLYPCMHL